MVRMKACAKIKTFQSFANLQSLVYRAIGLESDDYLFTNYVLLLSPCSILRHLDIYNFGEDETLPILSLVHLS